MFSIYSLTCTIVSKLNIFSGYQHLLYYLCTRTECSVIIRHDIYRSSLHSGLCRSAKSENLRVTCLWLIQKHLITTQANVLRDISS